MWRELCCGALLLVAGRVSAFASEPVAERSRSVVYVNGARYYVHTVLPGQTLYALGKLYGVSEETILERNPSLAAGLKAGDTIKIPVVESAAAAPEQLSPKKIRKTFDMHQVRRGETLYGISNRYSISVATILEDNPSLDPVRLRAGETLLIRKKAVGKSDEAANDAEWQDYRDRLNRAAEEGTAYHIVAPGETMYGLARRFGTTVEALSALNGIAPQELRSGSMIRVPAADSAAVAETSLPTEEALPELPQQRPRVDFLPLDAREELRIALLLPLSDGVRSNPNYLDFYQGFLLGLDRVRSQYGYSLRLDLFDTCGDSLQVRAILEEEAFRQARLIVGPVHEEMLPPVVAYAERHAVPVVSPLADIKSLQSDALFQMAPPQRRKYAKLEPLVFNENRQVTLIYGEHTDREFEREILAALAGKPCARIDYRYSSREENRDIQSLLTNDRENLLVILSNDGIEVDRILASIASATTSLVARGRTAPRFTIVGNSHWNRLPNLDRALYFKDRIVLFSTYHAKRDAEIIRAFDSDYIKAFGTLPSLYSYRGYDAAMIFAPAMYSDIQYDLESRNYTPLQTTYTFRQKTEGCNHVNGNWMRISYQPDFTITVD
ncbi:MAG: LysM peptidoglycan-binding domain-containing protein [Alistipes sp.]|nr:LysM peptidoglycan-binding domain-containing protein [Alistipes sp.]